MSVKTRLAAAGLPLVLIAGVAPAATAAEPLRTRAQRHVRQREDSLVEQREHTVASGVGQAVRRRSPAGTVNPWQSMIGQNDVPLEAGQPYTLRFTATATKNVTVRATVQLAVPPNTTTMNKTAALTSTPKTFEFTGTSTVATRTAVRSRSRPVARSEAVHAVHRRRFADRRRRPAGWRLGLRLTGAHEPARLPDVGYQARVHRGRCHHAGCRGSCATRRARSLRAGKRRSRATTR